MEVSVESVSVQRARFYIDRYQRSDNNRCRRFQRIKWATSQFHRKRKDRR